MLRRRLGWLGAATWCGLAWWLVVIALVTLVPLYGIDLAVPAETRSETCSLDYGGPAPEGFWIFSGGQRLLNTALFVPAGALLVLAAARWRIGWVMAPLGLLGSAAYSLAIELRAARAGADRPRLRRHRLRRQRDRRGDRVRDRAAARGGTAALARPRWMTASLTVMPPAPRPEPRPNPRPNVAAIPSYVAGKPPVPREGLTVYKLSSNENPYPPLPGVVEAATEAAERMNRYPDMGNAELYAALSAKLGVPVEHLALATGSVALIYQLVQAFCEPGDEVVYAWRSFEAYPIAVTAAAATSVRVPVAADGRHDLDAMAAAITDRTKVVLVCTPNNPTGPAVTQAELDAFLAKVPPHVLVVVDEAYVEFVRMADPIDGIATYRCHDNVLLTRTFSKAYGLAGFRVGYAVGPARDRGGAASGLAAVRRLERRAGGRGRVPRRGGPTAGAGRRAGRRARPGRVRAARRRVGRAGAAGQLRLVRPRGAHDRVRRRR